MFRFLFFLLFISFCLPSSYSFAACEGDQGDGTCVAYLWQNVWTGSTGGEACYGQRPDSIFLDSSCAADNTSSELCAPFDNARYEVKRYRYSDGVWSEVGSWLFYYTSTRAEPDFGSEGTEEDLPDDCCELAAQEECGEMDYTINSKDPCDYECKPCNLEAEGKDPAAECGSLAFVVWDDEYNCQYHCDRGDCEDEYQAAKQSCENPHLLDSETCEYTCECEEAIANAEQQCGEGYYLDPVTCAYECKCCDDKATDCVEYCKGADNVKDYYCEDSMDALGSCQGVDSGTYFCNCRIPPSPDSMKDSDSDPDDSPDGTSGPSNPSNGGGSDVPYDGDPETGSSPDPDSPNDPDNDPSSCLSCAEAKVKYCDDSCTWKCSHGSDGCAVWYDCDCNVDPVGDDGANGWISAIEDNTNRAANEEKENNEWNKAVKHNTDELLEDTDNIAENTRRGVDNDNERQTDGGGKSVFKDGSGKSYLQKIAENTSGNGTAEGTGSGTVPDANTYDGTLGEGFESPEDTFANDLGAYLAGGIPLVSYIQGSSIQLSSQSAVLTFSFYGHQQQVNFAEYVDAVDLAGNILLALAVLSSITLIVTRVKH